jgi:cytochrome c5
MKKLFVLVALVTVVFSCSKKSKAVATADTGKQIKATTTESASTVAVVRPETVPSPADGGDPTAPAKAELAKKGKEVYEAKCGRCHDLKTPDTYNEVRWVKIVDWMAPKAKLDAAEKEVVLAYVTLNAKK